MELVAKGPIDTSDPAQNSAMFRPVQKMETSGCRADSPAGASCSVYVTSFYADYTSAPGAEVKFGSALTGKNRWKIFEPKSNEYHTSVSLLLFGENHGWTSAQGFLETGIGSYDAPQVRS
jgi:hypothetical protein